MKYHDWHLSGYSVRDHGTTLALHLSWEYPGHVKQENHIQFSEVALYNFTHTAGAIITFIDEEPVSAFVTKEEPFIRRATSIFALRHWKNDLEAYRAFLQQEGFRYWTVESAIGFAGFVVAKSIVELAEFQNR